MTKYGIRIDNTAYWFEDKDTLLEFISMLIDGAIVEVDWNGTEKKAHTTFHLLQKAVQEKLPIDNPCPEI